MVKEIESPCCTGCWKWNKFGKECNVYWDFKKICTLREELEEKQ
tara:strand:- start:354 stop:485 length:132 start_codon:yes stop_codon:yes gene_type:complete